ncbi:MAG: NUDIX hydrolase, partial [Tepidiformaceae bacterium]
RMTGPPALERHFTSTAYIVSGGRTLLLWHRKLRIWLPPGGHLEVNEDPVQGALREALEETGLAVEVIPLSELLPVERPVYLPPPAAVGVFDIEIEGQPFHQHIDFVYYTRPLGPVDFDAPIPEGIHRWLTAAELGAAFSLPAPDGTLVPVAEDVRLLGLRAIAAAQH